MDARMKWEALDKRYKEKLIDKHRDVNVDYEWWGCTHENFKEQMKEIGITPKMPPGWALPRKTRWPFVRAVARPCYPHASATGSCQATASHRSTGTMWSASNWQSMPSPAMRLTRCRCNLRSNTAPWPWSGSQANASIPLN